jgi:N-acetylglucosaminyldiphosphoundecaprenol N-acetyl-beta-D-mannosaminyltransferase
VLLSRLGSHNALPERVAGRDLFWEIARASATQELRLFLLGGSPGAAAEAASAIMKHNRTARVVGTYCPPAAEFDCESEQQKIVRLVREAAPDILLVALGSPKQEKWIWENRSDLGVPLSIGVGASFEMAAGIRKRAPVWMQRIGLEWFYRFLQEPKRLFSRYFGQDMPYLAGAILRALTRRVRRYSKLSD